jgi:hypothetical protein
VNRLLLAACALGAAAPTLAMPTYYPSGPQTGVTVATVTGGGWTQCFLGLYGTPFGNDASGALSGCGTGDLLMLAARETGSNTLLVLAAAPRADTLTNTGAADNGITHIANGSGWYYAPLWSWGFVLAGDPVSKFSCDTNNTNAALKLCWHTESGIGGWRAGVNTGLNNSTAFERLIFVADSGAVVPAPAALALFGIGLAGLGVARRRN